MCVRKETFLKRTTAGIENGAPDLLSQWERWARWACLPASGPSSSLIGGGTICSWVIILRCQVTYSLSVPSKIQSLLLFQRRLSGD